MLDPDAPSAANPIMADWLHLGLINIKATTLRNGINLNEKNEDYETFMRTL